MARDIPLGNGQLLVTFDDCYQIRDLYFPHVGQENHTGGSPCRLGVWAPLPNGENGHSDRRRKRLYWSDQGWQIRMAYQDDTLATQIAMSHQQLQLEMRCVDVVDFHRPILVRRIEILNPTNHDREVRLFHHNNFEIYGTKVGDTAYFDPQLGCLVHYRQNRYLMSSWYLDGKLRIDQYATGTAGFLGAEGTWRDAEDGRLGNNAISQGAVDSTMMLVLDLPAGGSRVVYQILAAGKSIADLRELHRFLNRESPQGVIDRTTAYWRLWLSAARISVSDDDAGAPSERTIDLYKRSLLIVRTQVDDNGAIIAANDTDSMQFSRDTYSYLWPRDGALVAAALDDAGFPNVSRSFFVLCARIITEQGYFLHKYNPDGSPASSWHPWISLGRPQLPIQEDETALVIWALWRHFVLYRDIEFVRPLWANLIQPAADFMLRFRDPDTHLPLPSYDLWEERWGVHAFTVASVYGGLEAARQFAQCLGDTRRADAYGTALELLRDAFCRHFWSVQHDRFLRRIVPLDHDRTARLLAPILESRDPEFEANGARDDNGRTRGNGRGTRHAQGTGGGQPENSPSHRFEYDSVIDSSMYAIFAMGLLSVDDHRVEKTMRAVEENLWLKDAGGGLARYEGDQYHCDIEDSSVPGNPWFVCTMWLAEWKIAKAKQLHELQESLPVFDWVTDHALPSGVLAEQVHPRTSAQLSVSPLTWSHAAVVSAVTAYMRKLEQMNSCPTCGQIRRSDESGTYAHSHRVVPEVSR